VWVDCSSGDILFSSTLSCILVVGKHENIGSF
jgi:hypothetical protein